MLHATVVPVTAFAQNCSVIWCDRTGAGAVIDPGGDIDQIPIVDISGFGQIKLIDLFFGPIIS